MTTGPIDLSDSSVSGGEVAMVRESSRERFPILCSGAADRVGTDPANRPTADVRNGRPGDGLPVVLALLVNAAEIARAAVVLVGRGVKTIADARKREGGREGGGKEGREVDG